MTRVGLLSTLLFLFLVSSSTAQSDGKALAQKEELMLHERVFDAQSSARNDAPPKVAVWRRHVKPDKRDQFEAALRVFRRIGNVALNEGTMTPTQARAYRSLRVLPPSSVDENGNYTYLFVALPYVEEATYCIRDVLEMGRPPAEAHALYRQFQDALADSETRFALTPLP